MATAVGGVPDLLGLAQETLLGGCIRHERGLTAASGDAAGLAAALKDYVWTAHHQRRLLEEVARLYEEAAAE